jgi:DNA-binding YbaB/EbfC family protein
MTQPVAFVSGLLFMIKEMGQVMGLLKNLPKMQVEMEKLQQRIAQLTAEGTAGGGMVTTRVNGKMEIISCTISEEAWKTNDKELLEDLIKGATNQALEKVRRLVADETGKMTQSLGFPGMPAGMPGLEGLTGMMGS